MIYAGLQVGVLQWIITSLIPFTAFSLTPLWLLNFFVCHLCLLIPLKVSQTYQTHFHLAWAPNPERCRRQSPFSQQLSEPKLIGRHEHLSQILPTEEKLSLSSTLSLPSLRQPVKPKNSLLFLSSMSIDPDKRVRQLLQTYDRARLRSGHNWLQRRCCSHWIVCEHWPCTAPCPPPPKKRKGRVP